MKERVEREGKRGGGKDREEKNEEKCEEEYSSTDTKTLARQSI